MLTIHVAEATPETAVLVDGDRIAAVGPFDDLVAVRPEARVRRWPGILTPGLLNPFEGDPGPLAADEPQRRPQLSGGEPGGRGRVPED
ncbi:imidazolonepropionase-like domain-containing protein, partial [Streptomyces sp. NPDC001919]